MQFYRTFANRDELSADITKDSRFLTCQTYNWLTKHCNGDSVIATNRPTILSFYTARPTLRLPCRFWNPRWHIPEDMAVQLPKRMMKVGAKHLVIFAERQGLDEKLYGPFVSALSRREKAGNMFKSLFECPDGVVYELRDDKR